MLIVALKDYYLVILRLEVNQANRAVVIILLVAALPLVAPTNLRIAKHLETVNVLFKGQLAGLCRCFAHHVLHVANLLKLGPSLRDNLLKLACHELIILNVISLIYLDLLAQDVRNLELLSELTIVCLV